jgi:transposase-like protein
MNLHLLNPMTKRTRRSFTADFKAKVALEAIKNQKTLAELSHQFEVNAVTISKWKSEFLQNAGAAFGGEKTAAVEQDSPEMERLYAQIGQLKVELDFLKKSARKLGIPESEWK